MDFDHAKALTVARAVIAANWGLAEATGDDADTLAHDLATDLWKAHPNFDGIHAYSTFASQVCIRRMIDRKRAAERRTGHITAFITERESTKALFADGGPTNSGNLEFIPTRLNRERGAALGANAYAAALEYREQHGMSWRVLWLRMRLDASLVRLFGFPRCPARSSLHLAANRLRAWAKKQ